MLTHLDEWFGHYFFLRDRSKCVELNCLDHAIQSSIYMDWYRYCDNYFCYFDTLANTVNELIKNTQIKFEFIN